MRGLLSGNEEHAAAGFDTLNELVKPKIPSYVRETFSAFGVDYTAKNYIHELQGFWSMLRRFVSPHIAGYIIVGVSYT